VLDGVDGGQVSGVAVDDDGERAISRKRDGGRAIVAVAIAVHHVLGMDALDLDLELVTRVVTVVGAVEVGQTTGDAVAGLSAGERGQGDQRHERGTVPDHANLLGL